MKKLFLDKGKLMCGEFPEVLDISKMSLVDAYNAAVSAAKASAVEVVDFKDSDIFFEEGKLYDIREGWTVEIDTIETLPPKYEARLIPVKEQSSSIAATGVPEPDYTNFTPEVGVPESGETGKPIPILDAKRIAENYNYNQIVIVARKVGDNGIEHVTTYGTDKANCDVAANIGDFLRYEIMKWERKSVSPPPQAESQEKLMEELMRYHIETQENGSTFYSAMLCLVEKFTITRKP